MINDRRSKTNETRGNSNLVELCMQYVFKLRRLRDSHSLSTFQPYLEDRFLIHDTCGVHNLHGMPAVIGTIISIIMAAKADTALYGKVDTLEVDKNTRVGKPRL